MTFIDKLLDHPLFAHDNDLDPEEIIPFAILDLFDNRETTIEPMNSSTALSAVLFMISKFIISEEDQNKILEHLTEQLEAEKAEM